MFAKSHVNLHGLDHVNLAPPALVQKNPHLDEVGAVTLFMPEDFSNRIFERLMLCLNLENGCAW